MSNCSTLGSSSTLTCVWTFNNNCELLRCVSAEPSSKTFNNWNDCSINCCSLNTYSRQGVYQCISQYNTRLAIGLGIGLGYPSICLLIFFVCFKGKSDATSICLSLFWFMIPFFLCYKLYQRQPQPQPENKNTQKYNASETTNQIVLAHQKSQIKNQLKNIRELITNQKNNKKVERQKSLQNCIICQDRKRQVIGECGHFCVCKVCSARLNNCPVCRKNTNWKEVFMS